MSEIYDAGIIMMGLDGALCLETDKDEVVGDGIDPVLSVRRTT